MYRPEVGSNAIFEGGYQDLDGKEVEIIGYNVMSDGDEIVTMFHNLSGLHALAFRHISFRPLKSKRDEEIEEMLADAYSTKEWLDDSLCAALYAKGYRKQMPYAKFVQIITDYLYDNFTDYDNAMSDAAELAAKLNRTPDEE